MKTINLLFILLIIWASCYAQQGILGSPKQASKRLEQIKKNTVQILIDKEKFGTGFFVSEKGTLVTNYHVVFSEKTRIKNSRFGLQVLNDIYAVTSKNDTIVLKIKSSFMFQNRVNELIGWDYIILEPKDEYKASNYLKLGSSKDTPEGTTVYTCGFPLRMSDPFVSTGILSTKFKEERTINNARISIDKLYLDLTINKGNSGGALVALSENPEDDMVIGITSFIITPYSNELDVLNNYIDEISKRGNIELMGIDFLKYARIINTTINANSVGISGAISIDKIKDEIK